MHFPVIVLFSVQTAHIYNISLATEHSSICVQSNKWDPCTATRCFCLHDPNTEHGCHSKTHQATLSQVLQYLLHEAWSPSSEILYGHTYPPPCLINQLEITHITPLLPLTRGWHAVTLSHPIHHTISPPNQRYKSPPSYTCKVQLAPHNNKWTVEQWVRYASATGHHQIDSANNMKSRLRQCILVY